MSVKTILKPRSLSQFIIVTFFLLVAMVISGYIALGNPQEAERVLWSATQFMLLFFVIILIWVFISKKS